MGVHKEGPNATEHRRVHLVLARLLSIVFAVSFASEAYAQPDEHLLLGARAFQAGKFDEALAAFKIAERDPNAKGATWYIAAARLKLGEVDEALSTFLDAEASAPEHRDEILDYYFATAYAEAHIYTAADRLLASVLARAGPKIAAQAEKMRSEIGPLLSIEPPPASIDWYLGQANDALSRGKARLARAYFEEAALCGKRARPEYKVDEAKEGAIRAEAISRGDRR
jgi:tetratricopeptide (TPR) repeat protein